MCVNLILAHIWDAFGFLRKIGCDMFALWSLWIPRGTQILKCQGRWSCTRWPELGTLGHDQRERHWRRLTKNGKLLSKGLRSLGSRPKIAPNIEQCRGCPKSWSWRYYLQVPFYTSFSSLQLGAKASSWRRLATREASIEPLWRGFSCIRLQWIRGDRKLPRSWGNKMSNCSQCESKARWKALFFILCPRSIVLVRIIIWINSQGNYSNYFSPL
jgi:hypothetical protein